MAANTAPSRKEKKKKGIQGNILFSRKSKSEHNFKF